MQLNSPKTYGVRHEFVVRLVVFGVAINGFLIILGTLVDEIVLRDRLHEGNVAVSVSLIIGLTLLYLSRSLYHRKRVGWVVVVPVYILILGINLAGLLVHARVGHESLENFLRNIILPLVVVVGLLITERQFTVKSDLQSFRSSLRFIILVLVVALIYGVIGMQLLDDHDFHQELSIGSSFHYTIDQFDLTTNRPLVAYTKRARIFLDSLSVISIGAVSYGIIALFQPIKARFVDQSHNRAIMRALLERYPADSEDFFKLWPHDKAYFINYESTAGLAFHVRRGVALVIGDLAGDIAVFPSLLRQFDELCYVNDWTPALIHTVPKYNELYEAHDFTLQKLGEEAVLNVAHFSQNVANNKYFRNIKNKFQKAGYKTEVLMPPHSHEIVSQLREISQEWLGGPGRSERGLIMGYFSTAYIQQCPVMVVRDEHDVIQAFINQIHSFDAAEANFDMLRHTRESIGNINDFLLVNFIEYVQSKGFTRLNLGLCPLSGLDKTDDDSLINNILSFTYANGDRFYSFSGLRRFKEKYEPEWSDRYLAYRGGIPGLTKAFTALNGSWKVKVHFRN